MTTQLESNVLLLVNVADGDIGELPEIKTYVHIRYSNSPNGESGLLTEPAKYIGFYAGTSKEVPDDPKLYTWTVYNAGSNFIDIRYSDDGGNTLTEIVIENTDGTTIAIPNGQAQGSWMGVLITENNIVLQEDWYPEKEGDESNITLDDYTWTEIDKSESSINNFFLEKSSNNIYKFLTVNNMGEQFYEYSPNILTLSVKNQKENNIFVDNNIQIEVIAHYKTKEETKQENLTSTGAFGSVTIDFDNANIKSWNIFALQIKVFNINNNLPIITEVINIDYGTSDDMAKLSLNANNITASINEAGLRFSNKGLEVFNGNLTVYSGNNEPVFYVENQTGDVFFSGNLKTTKGTLGGWIIGDEGIYSIDNISVGIYSGNNIFYNSEERDNIDPIRFWAGKVNENYNLAITQSGILHANNAEIRGKIIANSGYFSSDFYVGSENSGIIISGSSSPGESFIGSRNYGSGSLGYGWKLSEDGSAEFNNIIARGKITSSVFEYNKISSIGGNLYVAPTIYLETESQAIQYVYNEESKEEYYKVTWELPYDNFASINGRDWNIGDIVKIDGEILVNNEIKSISNIDGTVLSITEKKPNKESSQLNLVENSQNSDETVTTITIKFNHTFDLKNLQFKPGTILVLYGSNNIRYGLYLSATDFGSPYLDVYSNAISEQQPIPAVRLGNLEGINDSDFQKSSLMGYGLYSSNAYLRGELILPQAGITNQMDICYEGTDNYIQVDPEGKNENSLIRIWAGSQYPNISSQDIAPFIVTQDGSLYASKGIFQGVVKATDSEFSGSIKAAGIVINNPTTPDIEAPNDHFFVAYSENPTNFNDYILNIDYTGLSIWEGGLRAYSDCASQIIEGKLFNKIYGYGLSNLNPLPYFYLVDNSYNGVLNARMVANKGHFLTIEEKGDNKYSSYSVILDNGIWFVQNNYENIAVNLIEDDIYKSFSRTGIFLDNKILKIIDNDGIQLNTEKTIYLNSKDEDIITRAESVFIRGQVRIENDSDLVNSLNLNNYIIQEAKDGKDNSIGIDIIIN